MPVVSAIRHTSCRLVPSGPPAGPAQGGDQGAGAPAPAGGGGTPGTLARTSEIPVGGGKVFDALKVVITQPTAGDYKAFSAICTHQGCTVKDVSSDGIKCPCHGSTFDIATGAVTKGPATKALPTKSVTVGSDGITVT